MSEKRVIRGIWALFCILSVPALTHAQNCADANNLNECINVRVVALVKAKTDQNSNTKQTETPSISENSTSLVDQSSASDLIGVGLNFAGLSASSQSKDMQPNSVSVTTTAYSLYSAFKGTDPLNPLFYNRHRDWRRLSLTLGYDDEKKEGSDATQRAKLIGAKYLIINRRDPNRTEFRADLGKILESLSAATGQFSSIINQTKTFIFTNEKVMTDIIEPNFREYLKRRLMETDLAAAAAAKIAAAADRTARANPNNTQAVVDGVTQEAQATVPTADTPREIRNAATDVFKAVRDAAKDPSKTAGQLADAAREESNRVAARESATKAHLEELQKTPDVKSLFVFQNGFLQDKSDEEIAAFRSEAIGKLTTGEGFTEVKEKLGDVLFDQIDKLIEKDLSSFTELRKISLDTIDRIRRAPQLSVAYFTKQRKEGVDDHTAELVFDWGVANKMNLTMNGAFEYRNSKVIGGDTRGARFAAQLRYQINRNDLESLLGNKTPMYFDLAAEGKWMNGSNSTVKAQAKLTIPLGNTGIQLPISFTVANRTELIKEKEVKGQFGFTFDFSKFVSALNPK